MSITVELTSSGHKTRITVDQAEFVRICPYCQVEYLTANIDQVYCRPGHSVMASRYRAFIRESRLSS